MARQRRRKVTNKQSFVQFEGNSKEIKGFVFDYTEKPKQDMDMFKKTCHKMEQYVRKRWGYNDIALNIFRIAENLSKLKHEEPLEPPEGATGYEKLLFKHKKKCFLEEKIALVEINKLLYPLVLGQCTNRMKAELKLLPKFADITVRSDGLQLLSAIKILVYRYYSPKDLGVSIVEAMQQFYRFRQPKTMDLDSYLSHFNYLIDVIEYRTGGPYGIHESIVREIAIEDGMDENEIKQLDKTFLNKYRLAARQKYLASAFLTMADRSRYGNLIIDLENQYLMGRNYYPKTICDSIILLRNWKQSDY